MLAILTGCVSSVQVEDHVMGMIKVRVKANSTRLSRAELEKVCLNAVEAARKVDRLMSTFKADSEITRLNNSEVGEWIKLSPETFEVLEKSIKYAKMTDGAFDMTVLSLVHLWGFGTGAAKAIQTPSDEEIARTLELVGYQNIKLDKAARKASLAVKGMKIGLGAIAKGYAVDRAIKVLKQAGVKNCLVEIGGETYAMGKRKDGEKWRIGVQHPTKLEKHLTVLEIENRAVATSGDYMNFYIEKGVRYTHIIDPKTGKPISNNVCSVTIITSDCTKGDALATAICVMGVKAGLDLINSLSDVEGIIVERFDGEKIKIHTSKGLKGKLIFSR